MSRPPSRRPGGVEERNASTPFPPIRRSRWPRIHWGSVVAVAVGGFVGGAARYAVGLAWPAAAGGVPWAIVTVNTVGAFVLALLLVLVLEVLPPTPYLRHVLGTGFCGALTTFSTVAAGADQLVTHGRAATAALFIGASLLVGLLAAVAGLFLGRAIAVRHGKERA